MKENHNFIMKFSFIKDERKLHTKEISTSKHKEKENFVCLNAQRNLIYDPYVIVVLD